jgi:regulatory protein
MIKSDTTRAAPSRRAGARGAPRDAYEDALRMLDVRGRTLTDMRRRLARRGHRSDTIEATITRLVSAGLLDDATYARQFARARLAAGRTAPPRVRLELMRRGVDRATAAAAIEEVLSDETVDVAAILDALVRNRAALLADLDARTRQRRLFAYLARRGFDADDIRRALRAREGSEAESRK